MKCLIVGAGLSGAVLARVFAEQGTACTVLEKRGHAGGHCHTERDARTGIMMHCYGPHIFHSDDDAVWDFVTRFARFRPFQYTVVADVGGVRYPLPINLDTLSQFFGRTVDAEEARAFVQANADAFQGEPVTFEDQALATVGPDLYRAFFFGYTTKQWGRHPRELPASVLKRLPLRFNHDGNYFHHARIGIPEDGYTALIGRMLDHPLIQVRYGERFERRDRIEGIDHVYYTGGLDAFFEFAHGRLPYRALRFEHFYAEGDYQQTVAVNYPDPDVPYTRITEHKRFTPWEHFDTTVCSREFSHECGPGDEPFYPVNLAGHSALLERYLAEARALSGYSFVGRLATFQYLDMDVAITRARHAAEVSLQHLREGTPIPALF